MFFVTGDIHGNPNMLIDFVKKHNLNEQDVIIILGDAGFNFHFNVNDVIMKERVNAQGPIFFCIHGNHEGRPGRIDSYQIKEWHGGRVYYEPAFPNILFSIDGEIYDFDGKKCIAIGGAYSVDKYYRILRAIMYSDYTLPPDVFYHYADFVNGKISDDDGSIRRGLTNIAKKFPYGCLKWFDDEQPNDEIKSYVESQLDSHKVDIFLTHTCPYRYEPREAFLPSVNQDSVDDSTERWLGKLEDKYEYEKWYCGHFHIDKDIDKIHFMFNTIKPLIPYREGLENDC